MGNNLGFQVFFLLLIWTTLGGYVVISRPTIIPVLWHWATYMSKRCNRLVGFLLLVVCVWIAILVWPFTWWYCRTIMQEVDQKKEDR